MSTKDENFEKIIINLEKIVSELETGELGLQQSLTRFEEGVKLYKKCKGELDKAEKKISVLTEGLKEEELD